MAEGTRAAKSLEEIKQQQNQEAQKLRLEELMQQIGNLTPGLQAVVQNQELYRGETYVPGQNNQHQNHEVGGVHMRSVRLEFPRFDGEDLTG